MQPKYTQQPPQKQQKFTVFVQWLNALCACGVTTKSYLLLTVLFVCLLNKNSPDKD